ncbi:MAG: apolipoprotein N-acyltransferase [Pseudomonadota bacterium]
MTDPLRSLILRHPAKLCLLVGALYPFAFAPLGLFPLALLGLGLLFAFVDDASPREAARLAFSFGVGAFATGTYWLYTSLHTFGGAPLPVALGLIAALIAWMAAWPALAAWVAVRWGPRGGLARWLLVLPASWVLAEIGRGWVLGGFPWLSLGYSHSDTFLRGLAPVTGVFGVSLAAALTAGGAVALVRGDRRGRMIAGSALAVVWLAAAGLDRVAWTTPSGQPLDVAIAQGSVPQDIKWNPEQLLPTMRLYSDLTAEHWGKDIVVWPEAAIPTLRSRVDAYFDRLGEVARENGTDLLIGFVDYREDTGQNLNGVMSLGANNSDYYKRHLVPFGEFFPVPAFIRNWMRLQNLPYRDYTRGAKVQDPLIAGGVPVAASICYEDVFGEELLWAFPEAALMVNVSNDAWFGTSIAPHQHLQIARLRAMEAGRYLLRGTNTGISAIIDEKGRVTARLPQFESATLSGVAQPFAGSTPYSRTGNWPVLLVALGLLVWGLGLGIRKP